MDYYQLAQAAILFLTPYLAAGGQEFTKSIAKDIWELVKKPFKSSKDEEIVNQLEKNPNDKELQTRIATKLEAVFAQNPEMAEKLEKLLKEANVTKNTKTTITQKQSFKNVKTGGDGVFVQAAGNVNISKTSSKATTSKKKVSKKKATKKKK